MLQFSKHKMRVRNFFANLPVFWNFNVLWQVLWRWHTKWIWIVIAGNGQWIVCGWRVYIRVWIVIGVIVASVSIWWWRRWIITLGSKHGVARMRTIPIEISIIHKIQWWAASICCLTNNRHRFTMIESGWWTKRAHKIKTNRRSTTVKFGSSSGCDSDISAAAFSLWRKTRSICGVRLRLLCTNAMLSTCCSYILIANAIKCTIKSVFVCFFSLSRFFFNFCGGVILYFKKLQFSFDCAKLIKIVFDFGAKIRFIRKLKEWKKVKTCTYYHRYNNADNNK